tara:strand:+ start:812 stop:1897 length:1086 start_codon:yes stop_codon:yes gene_type:complete
MTSDSVKLLKRLKNPQLKQICRDNLILVAGKKSILIQRILDNEVDYMPYLKELIGKKTKSTKKLVKKKKHENTIRKSLESAITKRVGKQNLVSIPSVEININPLQNESDFIIESDNEESEINTKTNMINEYNEEHKEEYHEEQKEEHVESRFSKEEIKQLQKEEEKEREKVLKQKMKQLEEDKKQKELEKLKPKEKKVKVSRIKKIVEGNVSDNEANDVIDDNGLEDLLESFDTRPKEVKNAEKYDNAYELAIAKKMKELEEKKLIEEAQPEEEDDNVDMDSLMNLIDPVKVSKQEQTEQEYDDEYEALVAQKLKELEELKNKRKRKPVKKILKDNYGLNLDDDCVFEEILDFIDTTLDSY